jgi:hypothetical protein
MSAVAPTQLIQSSRPQPKNFATFCAVCRRKRQTQRYLLSIAAEEDGEKLTLTLVTTCILLLNAGHETAVHTANSHRQNPAGSRDIRTADAQIEKPPV